MINKLWEGVSLANYNKWYPLTGIINETPEKYILTWPKVEDWFMTFALRAQNDINSYLNFIFYRFSFDSFKDETIKQTIIDMVFVMIEHWVYNRTPMEINVDASVQWNNGQSSFSSNTIPTINIWDLAPSRMKILASLTQLKQVLTSIEDEEIDPNLIDLDQFYTKNETNKLLSIEKTERIQADQVNHDFTLDKQIKLYDEVISNDKESETYRGPVSKLVNKSYVATDYDPVTETMILDWPNEIGTLPPEALQNNPQEKDYTHAATADFSAKQQKRITSNENGINNLKNTKQNVLTAGANIKIENDVISASWIIGEYKWMPPTVTSMPVGWKKVNIKNGYTLIQGNSVGTSEGELKKHFHFLNGSDEESAFIVPAVRKNETKFQNININGGSGSYSIYPITLTKFQHELININQTGYNNFYDDNLSAGLNATLWQYDPNNEFK